MWKVKTGLVIFPLLPLPHGALSVYLNAARVNFKEKQFIFSISFPFRVSFFFYRSSMYSYVLKASAVIVVINFPFYFTFAFNVNLRTILLFILPSYFVIFKKRVRIEYQEVNSFSPIKYLCVMLSNRCCSNVRFCFQF